MTKIIIKLKNLLQNFFLIDDSPHKVAGGAALGIFLGIAPGEGVLSTLFFAWLFRLNRLAALSGVAATNMWTTALFLPFSATIGGFLFHVSPDVLMQNFHANYSLGWKYFFSKIILFDFVLPLVVGLIVVAFAIAMIFYLIVYFSLKYKKISWE